ncbi:DUF4168 domain-containing protein [Psychroflexus salis]|uniref:DUF4168 domain-containing protein n=1 Tax=Psychroflexus salis TaxID=1526574 RepID=A0A916ZWJ1_9FLAO|nr:DUF4168 domain-containing protein [Psychroflexus salis]GGE16024.1 hypothetical protein GCM10010831_16690 [Psychroflexus salis]
MKKLFALVFAIALSSTSVFAQEQKISDKKFDMFVEVFQTIQQENNKAQMEMAGIIEGEGLTTERFNEIYQAEQNPQQDSDASAEEKKQHAAAMTKLEAKNKELQGMMEAKIKEKGLTMEDYQQIYQKVQTDPEMQQKLMARLQGQ